MLCNVFPVLIAGKGLLLVSLFLIGCRKQENSLPEPGANHFTHFSTQNSSLPNDQVNAVSVVGDAVWIGTQNGLAQLSKGAWKVFTPANSGLPSAVILSVAAVTDDCVWVGTDKGLIYYCGNKWKLYNTDNSLLKNNVVKKIAVDHQRNLVWAGTEGGLLKLAGNEQEWFDDDNSRLSDKLITALAVAENGSLFVGSFDAFQFQGSFWQYDKGKWTRIRLNNIGYASSFLNAVFVRGGKQWLGISGTSGGAVIAVENNQPVISYNRQSSPIIGGVTAVAEDDKGLWVATGAGLYQWQNGQWKHFDTKNSLLPDNHLRCMQADNGKVYLGTLQNGLVVWQP